MIIAGVLLAAAAVFAYMKMDFLSGRIRMTFEQKTATAAETDRLGQPAAKNGQKVLVAYFSWGGNTRSMAQEIHHQLGGDIYEIRTVQKYPDEYDPACTFAKKELDDGIRPELLNPLNSINDYDIVFIGYPIWWYTVPMPVISFAERYSFKGKTVIPFCTSGGDTIDSSLPDIE